MSGQEVTNLSDCILKMTVDVHELGDFCPVGASSLILLQQTHKLCHMVFSYSYFPTF